MASIHTFLTLTHGSEVIAVGHIEGETRHEKTLEGT